MMTSTIVDSRVRVGPLLTLLAALLGIGAPVASAQSVTLAAGSRVRVTAPAVLDRRVEGHVVAGGPDSLGISFLEGWNSPKPTTMTVPASAVQRIEVYAGRSRGRGALRGAAIGGLLGVGFAMATSKDRNSDARSADDSLSHGTYVAAGAFLFGGVGALLGGIIGTERWVRVATPVRVTMAPRRGTGMSLVVTRP